LLALAAARLRRRNERLDQRPLVIRQVARIAQMITMLSRAVLVRPHRRPPPRIRTASLESQPIPQIQQVLGRTLSVNPAWSALLGWSEDEIKRMHVSELRHPDDAPAAIAERARLARGVPTVRMENRFRHKDGSWRWLSWTLSTEDGLIYVIGRHITAEKEAAERLAKATANFACS